MAREEQRNRKSVTGTKRELIMRLDNRAMLGTVEDYGHLHIGGELESCKKHGQCTVLIKQQGEKKLRAKVPAMYCIVFF